MIEDGGTAGATVPWGASSPGRFVSPCLGLSRLVSAYPGFSGKIHGGQVCEIRRRFASQGCLGL